MRVSQTLSGTLLVAGAATLWGINGTVSSVVMSAGLEPTRLAEARITLAAILLLAWVAWRERPALRLSLRELAAYACFGVFGLILVQWFYFEAITRIPISISLVIEYSAPLLVALWVRFVWRRAMPWQAWLALPAAIVGLVCVLGVVGTLTASLSGVGIVFSVGSALAYAYYILHSESLMRKRSPVAVLGLGMGMATVAFAAVLPWWSFPWSTLAITTEHSLIEAPLWALVLFIAVIGTTIPFAMILAGVKRIGADGATVTAMLEPIIAGAIAWAFLGQSLTLLQTAGVFLVLAAVTFAQVGRARAARV